MPENDTFWDYYWEMRLQAMENLGKREAILAASALIRREVARLGRPLRVLEPGCGEGQVVGTLVDSHAQLCEPKVVVGIDYNRASLERCRQDYPHLLFREGDFTNPAAISGLRGYDILLLVNALHEVYSAETSPELGEVNVPAAKQRVEQALAELLTCLAPGGWLVLFDGLEPPGDSQDRLQICFLDDPARVDFETFARQYQPFHIQYTRTASPLCVELSRRDFSRYITKSIFLGKPLWQTERLESYQYYSEPEFRAALSRLRLQITELRTLTVNEEKWRRRVRIETPGEDFPPEHILILAQKVSF